MLYHKAKLSRHLGNLLDYLDASVQGKQRSILSKWKTRRPALSGKVKHSVLNWIVISDVPTVSLNMAGILD